MFSQIIANNRAGGWRKLKSERYGVGQEDCDGPQLPGNTLYARKGDVPVAQKGGDSWLIDPPPHR